MYDDFLSLHDIVLPQISLACTKISSSNPKQFGSIKKDNQHF